MSKITSGKFRRYNHKIYLKNFLNPIDTILNIRDIFFIMFGLIQSFIKLTIWRPNVVFAKGGFVSVPIGIAAKLLRIPIVIHDSDAHPGLANRILARWSKYIATGAPEEYYNYPRNRLRYVGVPITDDFYTYNNKKQLDAKINLGIDTTRPLIVVTGGGLGASRLNAAIVKILKKILKKYSLILISGSGNYNKLKSLVPENNKNFKLVPFVAGNIDTYFGAADLVIARAGATTILELSAMSKPTILIPNHELTGGHQVKNAEVYLKARAAEVLSDQEITIIPETILNTIDKILENNDYRKELSENFKKFSKPNAAKDVAELIIQASSERYENK